MQEDRGVMQIKPEGPALESKIFLPAPEIEEGSVPESASGVGGGVIRSRGGRQKCRTPEERRLSRVRP